MFKTLAFGAPYVTMVGIGRAAMAAAMSAKKVGELIAEGNVPKEYAKFGSTVPEIFADLRELRSIYGERGGQLPHRAPSAYSPTSTRSIWACASSWHSTGSLMWPIPTAPT